MKTLEEVGDKIFNEFHQLSPDDKIRLIATLAIFESRKQSRDFFKVQSESNTCIIAVNKAATDILGELKIS